MQSSFNVSTVLILPRSGELFSVSSWKAKRLQNLVVFNERAPYLDGFFSMTPVGAANVGSIKINFDAVYTLPPHFFFLVFHDLTCASYGDERMCVLHPLQTMHHAWSWYVKSMPWHVPREQLVIHNLYTDYSIALYQVPLSIPVRILTP